MHKTSPHVAVSRRPRRDGKALPKPKGDQLPRCFWHVKPTVIYGADCVAGEKLRSSIWPLRRKTPDRAIFN